jgi:serine/threonine protein kinase
MADDSNKFPDYTRTTIDDGRLFLASKIQSGAAGVVYRAVDIRSSARTMYAVKWVGVPAVRTHSRFWKRDAVLARADNEIACHGRVSAHPNVLALRWVVEDEARSCRWLVLDWCPGGDMFDALNANNWWWRDEARFRSAALQLVDAVMYCHAQGVYHRDIKPENVLCSEDGSQLYLADFGVATTEPYSTEARVGTREFLSPGRSDPPTPRGIHPR